MTTPIIRQATFADLPYCASIYRDAFAAPPYYEEWRHADAVELLTALLSRHEETCFCLEWEGRVVGFAFCSTLGRFRATVEEIALEPYYQGRGWGAFLLDHCLSVFRQRGYRAVELIANMEAPAFGFYQKLGFRPARRNVLMIREF